MDALLPEWAKLGILGLVVGLLLVLLWQAHKRIRDLEKALTDSQEKRIAEAKEQGEIIRGNMTALNSLKDTILQRMTRR